MVAFEDVVLFPLRVSGGHCVLEKFELIVGEFQFTGPYFFKGSMSSSDLAITMHTCDSDEQNGGLMSLMQVGKYGNKNPMIRRIYLSACMQHTTAL